LFESISSQKVRKASNLFPAERGMKGLAFALDPDGYWIEIAACPVKFRSSRDQGFWMLISSQVGAFLYWGSRREGFQSVKTKVRREKLGWSDAWTQKK